MGENSIEAASRPHPLAIRAWLQEPMAPLFGYNTNFRHGTRLFHIQTEDSGPERGHVMTHVFVEGGRIIATRKGEYAAWLGMKDLASRVRALMQRQHKEMCIAIRDGMFEDLVRGGVESSPSGLALGATAQERADSSVTGTETERPMSARPRSVQPGLPQPGLPQEGSTQQGSAAPNATQLGSTQAAQLEASFPSMAMHTRVPDEDLPRRPSMLHHAPRVVPVRGVASQPHRRTGGTAASSLERGNGVAKSLGGSSRLYAQSVPQDDPRQTRSLAWRILHLARQELGLRGNHSEEENPEQ